MKNNRVLDPAHTALRASGAYSDGSPRLLCEIQGTTLTEADQQLLKKLVPHIYHFPRAFTRFARVFLWLRKLVGLRPY